MKAALSDFDVTIMEVDVSADICLAIDADSVFAKATFARLCGEMTRWP